LEKYSVRVGDVFVNEGGDVGRNAIWLNDEDEEFAFQNQLHRLRPVCGVESRYVQFVLRHAKSSGVIAEMSSGVTIQHFSATAIRKLAFPLPPVEEQRRIVVKVNELMTMCDGLENSLLNRNELAKKISDALVSNIF
jgi:type I restriction enzyme S subunit